MNGCIGCIYADWKRTKTGRMSPTGDGKCRYEYRVPELPVSMYWVGRFAPAPAGGHISRKETSERRCPYYRGQGLRTGKEYTDIVSEETNP